jgi:hypothetical protein
MLKLDSSSALAILQECNESFVVLHLDLPDRPLVLEYAVYPIDIRELILGFGPPELLRERVDVDHERPDLLG